MSKKTGLLFSISLMCLLSFLSITPLASQISVGSVLQYKVTKSKISAKVGPNSVESKGFTFNGVNYPQKTTVTATIAYIGAGMNGQFQVNNDTRNFGYTTTYLKSRLQYSTFMSCFFAGSLIDFWERENFANGFYLFLYPYLEPTDVSWNFLDSLGIDMFSELDSYVSLGHDLTYNYQYQETTTRVYLETYTSGIVSGQYDAVLGYPYNLPEDSSFTNRFQVAFDRSTGQLLGMRMKGETTGTSVEGDFEVSLDYKIEKTGYNLPLFKVNSPTLLLLSILLPAGIVGLIVLTIFVVRRYFMKRS